MNILSIDPYGLSVHWCLDCIAAGHTVKLITVGPKAKPIGEGLVDKFDNWQQAKSYAKFADLIFVADNVDFMDEVMELRKQGLPVFGPDKRSARLEVDRMYGQNAIKSCGNAVIPSTEFSNYDQAIAFVKANPNRYCCKPCGEVEDKSLTYLAKDPADMIGFLTRMKKVGKKAGITKFILQEFKKGTELAVMGMFGPHGFNSVFCENFEHKKLMNGDLGVSTGEMGCYDEETEVLTSGGWKFWRDVTISDELATLVDGKTIFELPSQVVSFDVDGDMVQWKNQSIDILVTPNHNMYVQKQQAARNCHDDYEFILAEDCLESQYSIKRTAEWSGYSPETFVIPKTKQTPAIELTFSSWAGFLGIYFADGSCDASGANIASSHLEKSIRVKDILDNTKFNYIQREYGFDINNTSLRNILKPFGKSYEKRVPDYIKNATSEDIQIFLDAFCVGDGHVNPKGCRYFYTSNPGLADDIQELLLKTGGLGIVKKLKDRTKFNKIDGRIIYQRRPAYVIFERTKKIRSWLDIRDRKIVQYTGKVYCATVSSHVLFVRRNGKPIWCGNTAIRYTKDSKLADIMLKPLEKLLHELKYVGFVDISVIVDENDGTPWPMEFTQRPGYPIHNIQQPLIVGDPAQWMVDLINGKDTFEIIGGETCVGVVMACGDFPFATKEIEAYLDFPVITDDVKDISMVSPCEIKLSSTIKMVDDEVVENYPEWGTAGTYIVVCMGIGDTITQAKDAAYTVVKQVKLGNDPAYRTDIGDSCEDRLKQLHKFDYCNDWKFK